MKKSSGEFRLTIITVNPAIILFNPNPKNFVALTSKIKPKFKFPETQDGIDEMEIDELEDLTESDNDL